MKFTCGVNALIEGLQICTKALSSRTTNPVLEGVLIETDIDTVILTCSDERVTIVTRIDARVEEMGRGIVPGKLFSEIVRRLPAGDVTIRMNDKRVFAINAGPTKLNLAGQDAELFPLVPKMDDNREVRLPQDVLKDMIAKTEFAIAVEDMREVLTGCYLEIDHGMITMVALDGFRLALRRVRGGDEAEKIGAIIPGRAIGDIGKLLSDDKEAFATLTFDKNKLHIAMEKTDIYCVLVQGQYIDYNRILPKQFNTKMTVALEPLRKCVDRAALIAREGNNNLLILKIESGVLTVEAHSQIGDVHEEMECEQDGADLNIAFNVKYLTDVVRNITSENAVFNMVSPIQPCIITPDGDKEYVHLVLPVRTSTT